MKTDNITSELPGKADKTNLKQDKTSGRWRFYRWLLIAIPLFFTFIAFGTSKIISSRLRTSNSEHYQLLANDTAETINTWLSAKKEIVLNQRASLEIINDYSREYLTSFLEHTINERDDSNEICDLYFVDKDGVLSTANGYYTDYDLRTREYYLACTDTRDVYYTSPYRDISTGSYIMTLSAGCNDNEGNLAGVLAIDIYIDAFLFPVNFTQVPKNSYIYLVDSNYGLASHPNEAFGYVDELPRLISDLPGDIYSEVEDKLKKKEYDMITIKDYDGIVRDMFISDISSCNWCVVAAISDDEFKSNERLMIAYIIAALFISLAIGILWTLFGAKRMMDQLNEATAAAESANESKSLFLASMSHEIRTPINAILGMNEMIMRSARQAEEREESWDYEDREIWDEITVSSGNIKSAGHSLLAIINDILDFSKIEAGKMEIVEGEYHLSSVLNDVRNTIYFKAKEKGLKLIVDVDAIIPDLLYGDEQRLRQVMVNLLGNAVKYTNEGNVRLSVEAGATQKRPEGLYITLLIKVRDTGIGIRKEDIDKLFNKFERVDMQKNSSVEGTGLGLPITQSLLSLMGGDISVDSEYGKGSLFTARLLQRVISSEPIGNFNERYRESLREGNKYEEMFRAPSACILVVDDTEMNLAVIKGLLRKTEIMIDTAPGGRESTVMAEKKKYDLILMDQRMPDMNGTEAMKSIRSSQSSVNKDTNFICLTADAVNGARERYLAEGFIDYLTKPVDGVSLEKMLLKYLPGDKIQKRDDADSRDGREMGTGKGMTAYPDVAARAGAQTRDSRKAGPQKYSETDAAGKAGLQTKDSRKAGSQKYSETDAAEKGSTDVTAPVPSARGEESLQDLLAEYGIDHDEGMKNCMNDPEFYREILSLLAAGYEENSEKLERFYRGSELPSYAVIVHSIKSSARTIGAIRLSELALSQEKDANSGDMEKVSKGHAVMADEYRKTVEAIRSAAGKGLLEEG
ncbi:MAG: response regulator [Lachnospiraceae bacterium]|nr:response regulator [Lachnospiraceae bacterium]